MGTRIRFGEFELDQDNFVLTRDGAVVRLAPQPFKVLLHLVQSPGALVTREALRQAIWGSDTVVDFEHGLNTCIRSIRAALGDEAEHPRFIETVPRLGYRFKAAVEPAERRQVLPERTARMPLVMSASVVALTLLVITATAFRWSQGSAATRERERDALYLRGRVVLEDRTSGTTHAALEFFQKALAIDNRYAPAYAGIADVFLVKPSSLVGVPPAEATARARQAIEQALTLDEHLPDAHLSAAQLWMTLHDWPRAGREYLRAIELAPKHAAARQDYARWLAYQRRFDEGLEQARLGEALDPLSPRARVMVAEVLRSARRFDEAIVQARKALELNPNYGAAHVILGHAYLAQNKLDAAIEEHRRSSHSSGNLAFAYALGGREKDARDLVAFMQERYAATQDGAGEIAQAYVGLREYDRAFQWLDRAVSDGSVWTLQVAVVWDPLRADARFERLLHRAFFGT